MEIYLLLPSLLSPSFLLPSMTVSIFFFFNSACKDLISMEEKQVKQPSRPSKNLTDFGNRKWTEGREKDHKLNKLSCIWTWADPRDLHLCKIIHLLLGSVIWRNVFLNAVRPKKECTAELTESKRIEIYRNSCLSFAHRTLFSKIHVKFFITFFFSV